MIKSLERIRDSHGLPGEREYHLKREKAKQSPRGRREMVRSNSKQSPGAGRLVYFPEICEENLLMGCLFS